MNRTGGFGGALCGNCNLANMFSNALGGDGDREIDRDRKIDGTGVFGGTCGEGDSEIDRTDAFKGDGDHELYLTGEFGGDGNREVDHTGEFGDDGDRTGVVSGAHGGGGDRELGRVCGNEFGGVS